MMGRIPYPGEPREVIPWRPMFAIAALFLLGAILEGVFL